MDYNEKNIYKPLAVSEAAYRAMEKEALAAGIFTSSVYCQFLRELLLRHGESTAGVPAPKERLRPRGRRERTRFQLSAAFASGKPIQAVATIWHRWALDNDPMLSQSDWLREQLRLWLNERGNDLAPDEMWEGVGKQLENA